MKIILLPYRDVSEIHPLACVLNRCLRSYWQSCFWCSLISLRRVETSLKILIQYYYNEINFTYIAQEISTMKLITIWNIKGHTHHRKVTECPARKLGEILEYTWWNIQRILWTILQPWDIASWSYVSCFLPWIRRRTYPRSPSLPAYRLAFWQGGSICTQFIQINRREITHVTYNRKHLHKNFLESQ